MRELALHILDLLQNAVEAQARNVELTVQEDMDHDRLTITIADDGRGMDTDTVRQVQDPFFTTRTTRHVGLGLPLFAAAAQRCDGQVVIESQPGQGTRVVGTFCNSHIDRAPLGDMAGSLLAFLLGSDSVRLDYRHSVGDQTFELDSQEVRAEVGDLPFSYPPLRAWLRETLAEGEAGLAQHRAEWTARHILGERAPRGQVATAAGR